MATSNHYDTGDEANAHEPPADCPECGGQVRVTSTETVCADCGLVLDEEPIDHGPEWTAFDDDESNPERTGAPLTPARHDRGLSTEIGRQTDARGNQLSGRKRCQLDRLRREQSRGRWRSKREQNLAHGLGEVRRVASALSLPDSIRNRACVLFRQAHDAGELPGRSIDTFAAASVYGACRCAGLPRTIDEVQAYAGCEQSQLLNAYGVLNREFGLPTQPMLPSEFVPRFASELDVSRRIRRRALELAEQAESNGLAMGAQPTGFAGACLYKAAREQGLYLTQGEVAAVVNASKATIRTHRDSLKELCS